MFRRRLITSALIMLTLTALGWSLNGAALTKEESETGLNQANLVRLHILANSDGSADQQIKLRVRDVVLARTSQLFLGARDAAGALNIARANKEALGRLATGEARGAGAGYGARIEIGRFIFPSRSYPFGTLPAGKYQAVRIILGRGKGKNWWCVLFPPLCWAPSAKEQAPGPIHLRCLFIERLWRAEGAGLNAFWKRWCGIWHLGG